MESCFTQNASDSVSARLSRASNLALLMAFRTINGVYSEDSQKITNILSGRNLNSLTVNQIAYIYDYQWPFKGLRQEKKVSENGDLTACHWFVALGVHFYAQICVNSKQLPRSHSELPFLVSSQLQ